MFTKVTRKRSRHGDVPLRNIEQNVDLSCECDENYADINQVGKLFFVHMPYKYIWLNHQAYQSVANVVLP
jgi:hypothetical protein